MSWYESSVIDERLRFLARVLDGEPMTEVWPPRYLPQDRMQDLHRYKEHGLEALSERSARWRLRTNMNGAPGRS